MADFVRDTAVTGKDGRYRATLSPEWDVWGPLGGYVAAIALRAIAAESSLPVPASFTCQFISVGAAGEVDIAVETLRRGKRSQALRLTMSQGERVVLAASGWTVAEGMTGLVHSDGRMPDVPPPEQLKGFADLAENYDEWYPVWRTIDGRPVVWSEEPRRPEWHTWMRLFETPAFEDRFVEAARSLMWLDLMMWNAAVPPHLPWPLDYIAPNLDLAAVFHDRAPDDEWLLCDAHSPRAADGLVGCTGRVWARDGRLLVSGTSTLFCRPAPTEA